MTIFSELVFDVNDDGLPIRLLLLTEQDYAIRIVTCRLSLCKAPQEKSPHKVGFINLLRVVLATALQYRIFGQLEIASGEVTAET